MNHHPNNYDPKSTQRASFSKVTDGPDALRIVLRTGDEHLSLDFKSEEIRLTPNGEALAACSLLPAMATGRGMILEMPVSSTLAENLPRLQEIYQSWQPELQTVATDFASSQAPAERRGNRVALFFTGGVDSYHSLLKHQDEITDLIFVHGFDIPLLDICLCQQVEQVLRHAAAALGKNFIKVETNIRASLDLCGNWGQLTHGSALAAVAHLLPPTFKRVYIASSDTLMCPVPWGSHPITDPLWSSSSLSIIHDGCEADRHQKVQRIASNPTVLKTLRVCWVNKHSAYNCGQCEKCLRTMMDLSMVGALSKCTTFDQPLRLWRVALMKEPWNGVIRDFLNTLRSHVGHHGLRWALRLAHIRNRIRQALK